MLRYAHGMRYFAVSVWYKFIGEYKAKVKPGPNATDAPASARRIVVVWVIIGAPRVSDYASS